MNMSADLYDIAKTVAIQAPLMTPDEIENSKTIVRSFFERTNSEYYMMLFRDINYYTLFEADVTSDEQASDIFIECLQNIGEIISVQEEEENPDVIEIWIKTNESEAIIGYLFDYQQGVVKCKLM